MLSGTNKERMSSDQLSLTQWLAAFYRSIREDKKLQMRDYMLEYLISLLDDSQDLSWAVTEASHAVLLCQMEQK